MQEYRADGFGTDQSVAALVLKRGSYPLHHGGLAVARSLGRLGVPTYATCEHRRTPLARSRYLRGSFPVPPSAGPAGDRTLPSAALGEAIRSMLDRIGKPTVIIATDDDASVALDEHRSNLPATALVPRSRPGLAAELVDKQTCHDLLESVGVPVPAQHVLQCPVDERTLREVPLPSVLKRARRQLLPDGGRTFGTLVARTPQHLRFALQDRRFDSYAVLVQALFEGEDWLYHAYVDSGSQPMLAGIGRKLRSYPPRAGETSFARSENQAEVREVCESMLSRIGYVGAVSMDLRRDAHDGQLRVLDVNPRVGACFRLFTTAAGADVVRVMHADLAGVHIRPEPQLEGRTYVVETYDASARSSYPGTSMTSWLRAVRSAHERAWLTARDPLPVAVLAAAKISGAVRR